MKHVKNFNTFLNESINESTENINAEKDPKVLRCVRKFEKAYPGLNEYASGASWQIISSEAIDERHYDVKSDQCIKWHEKYIDANEIEQSLGKRNSNVVYRVKADSALEALIFFLKDKWNYDLYSTDVEEINLKNDQYWMRGQDSPDNFTDWFFNMPDNEDPDWYHWLQVSIKKIGR